MIAKLHQQHETRMKMKIILKEVKKKNYEKKIERESLLDTTRNIVKE